MYVLIKGICTEKGRDTGTRNAGSAFAGWRECLCRSAVWKPYGRELNRNEAPDDGLGDDPVHVIGAINRSG